MIQHRAARPQVRASGPAARSPASPFAARRDLRRPALRPDVLAAIFVGGCLGGWARYAITSAWPSGTGAFPWSTLIVNWVGAFVLAVVLIAAAALAPTRYLRPILGTGFCGAFTTFSALAVSTDQLLGHGHIGIGLAYLTASVIGGLAFAVIGLLAGRQVFIRERRPSPTALGRSS